MQKIDHDHVYHQSFPNGLFGKYLEVYRLLSPGSKILEIGCHTGYFSKFLLEAGHFVLGIEHDEKAANVAREMGVQVICGNIESEDFIRSIQQTFDVILLMDVLEHTRSPSIILRKMKALLNVSGRIVVTGPNVANLVVRKDLLFGQWDYKDTGILDRTHLRFFTAKTWCGMVKESGYQIVNFKAVEGIVPWVHHLGKVATFRRIPEYINNLAINYWPTLFAINFMIEAVPNNLNSD